MTFSSLISRIIALIVLVAPLAGCAHHVTQTTPIRKPAAPSSPQIQELLPRDMPVEELQLRGLDVQLWNGTSNSPPHTIFSRDKRLLLRREFDRNSDVSFVKFNHERSDPDNDSKLKLDGRHHYILIESRSQNDTYKYFVYSTSPKVELCATAYSGIHRLRAIEVGKRTCLCMYIQDRLPGWGARTVCPAVKFVWRWDGTGFQLDSGAMRDPSVEQPAPDLRAAIAEQFKLSSAEAPPELADEVLSRYYAGQGRSARHFFNECWPKRRSGKERYWRFLFSEAKKGKYWTVAKALNERTDRPRIPKALVPNIEQQPGNLIGPI